MIDLFAGFVALAAQASLYATVGEWEIRRVEPAKCEMTLGFRSTLYNDVVLFSVTLFTSKKIDILAVLPTPDSSKIDKRIQIRPIFRKNGKSYDSWESTPFGTLPMGRNHYLVKGSYLTSMLDDISDSTVMGLATSNDLLLGVPLDEASTAVASLKLCSKAT